MSVAEFRKILRSLLDGIDPTTGEKLPKKHLCRHPMLTRAFETGLRRTAGFQAFNYSWQNKPKNDGNIWAELEERKLMREFKAGMTINRIAKKHERTEGAIRARLIKLKLIEE
jgi:hypothetical protein